MGKETIITSPGWTAEKVVLDKKLLVYINRASNGRHPKGTCCQCHEPCTLGQEVVLVKDNKGLRRLVTCSIECHRQRFFEQKAERNLVAKDNQVRQLYNLSKGS